MKKRSQRTFNNENVHWIIMFGLAPYPLYSPWLMDIFHQRGKVIDSSPASHKSSAPSETKCLTSPSLSRPQKLSRTTWPETHRPHIIVRPRDYARQKSWQTRNQLRWITRLCTAAHFARNEIKYQRSRESGLFRYILYTCVIACLSFIPLYKKRFYKCYSLSPS